MNMFNLPLYPSIVPDTEQVLHNYLNEIIPCTFGI